ncbi:hypothetical protein SAMN04487783_1098 [Agrococcus baldri]|uniref:Uncharacterized protein n=1 Tax=Agrococcus baldri TaxID=153730 RepID=A0AA94HLQ3_9MICO|nr:hypothetical protein [Agrococcus baldri]SFS08431.1 hypothetical protein SAMN04487783_1098 [Agrococcus baldri]
MTQPAPQPEYAQPQQAPIQHASHQQAPGQYPQRYVPHASMRPAADRPRKALAMVALALAVLVALMGPIQALITMALIRSGTAPSMIGMAGGVMGLVVGALSLGALGLGIGSVLRRERPRVLAGVAIGVGALGLVGLLSAGLQTLVFAF